MEQSRSAESLLDYRVTVFFSGRYLETSDMVSILVVNFTSVLLGGNSKPAL